MIFIIDECLVLVTSSRLYSSRFEVILVQKHFFVSCESTQMNVSFCDINFVPVFSVLLCVFHRTVVMYFCGFSDS